MGVRTAFIITTSLISLLSLVLASASTLSISFLSGCGTQSDPSPRTANPTPVASPPPSYLQAPVNVIRVIDGDTIEIEYEGETIRVRIKGINTPELHPEPEGSPPQPFAEEAKTYTLRNIGPQVDLEFNSDCTNGNQPAPPMEICKDFFGRLLAYIRTSDGKDYGPKILTQGLAKVYRLPGGDVPAFDRKNTYLDAEKAAQSRNAGIWGNSSN